MGSLAKSGPAALPGDADRPGPIPDPDVVHRPPARGTRGGTGHHPVATFILHHRWCDRGRDWRGPGTSGPLAGRGALRIDQHRQSSIYLYADDGDLADRLSGFVAVPALPQLLGRFRPRRYRSVVQSHVSPTQHCGPPWFLPFHRPAAGRPGPGNKAQTRVGTPLGQGGRPPDRALADRQFCADGRDHHSGVHAPHGAQMGRGQRRLRDHAQPPGIDGRRLQPAVRRAAGSPAHGLPHLGQCDGPPRQHLSHHNPGLVGGLAGGIVLEGEDLQHLQRQRVALGAHGDRAVGVHP